MRNRKKIIKLTILELIQKNMLTKKYVKIVLSNNTKYRVIDFGIQPITLEYALELHDGSIRPFDNRKDYYFEVPGWYKEIRVNKERQYK